jgi:hypothetical protein
MNAKYVRIFIPLIEGNRVMLVCDICSLKIAVRRLFMPAFKCAVYPLSFQSQCGLPLAVGLCRGLVCV